MTLSSICWAIASVSFIVSLIMAALAGSVFAMLNVIFCVVGWILWAVGLISKLRGD